MAKKTADNDIMLTTYDNPFNPFTEFEAWWKYDHLMYHNTCEHLAREALISEVYSDEVNERLTHEAMQRMCEQWPVTYKMVRPTDYMKVG